MWAAKASGPAHGRADARSVNVRSVFDASLFRPHRLDVGAKGGQDLISAATLGGYDGDDARIIAPALSPCSRRPHRLSLDRPDFANEKALPAWAAGTVGPESVRVLAPPGPAPYPSAAFLSGTARPMDPLIEGYRRFRAEVWPAERARYEALAHWGQSPEAMVIACSDSRVDPQTIFGAAPGELFVVRNVAALVPPYSPDPGHHGTSAALEFGVKVLKIARLVVLGHGRCGGVKAMAHGAPPQARDFIASWVEIGAPAVAAAGERPEGRLERIEAEVVRLSLANLVTFPWIAEAVAANRLALQGYWFDVHTGVLAGVGPDALEPVQ
jgi:carbonic anhydrase